MQFRSDIQGIRGIAVLGVFLFHLDLESVSGGYVGVDVFFVISGFLITGIIAADMRAGTFTFARFYNRRMKRILPAFQLVGLTTLAAGAFLLLPNDRVDLLKSLLASTLFASNLYFWKATQGYFASSSDEMPLLHNWSLSVEEQFYFLWPLMLLLLLRFIPVKRHLPVILCVAIAGTFALAEWATDRFASAAYYLLPTRAGEFLFGALLVFVPEGRRHARPLIAQSLGIIGLLLVLGSNILLTPDARFPGLNAFWPCLGTALLIDSGRREGTLVSALLSFKPLVFIGTISYSLYLWHWPPIAFLHYFNIELSALDRLALFCGVLVVAYLSWRFVEEPLRGMRWHLPRTALAFALLPLFLQAGAFVHQRSQPPAFASLAEIPPFTSACPEGLTGPTYPERCLIGDERTSPSFALWGDSFAGVLWPAMEDRAARDHASGYLLTLSACPSISGIVWDEFDRSELPKQCRSFVERTLDFLVESPAIETVVLTSNYAWYLTAINPNGKPMVSAADGGMSIPDEFRETLKRLAAAGKRIVIIMPHTYDKVPFMAALRRGYASGATQSLIMPKHVEQVDAITAMIEELSKSIEMDLIYPDTAFCDSKACHFFDEDGDVHLSDGAHLSMKTARKVLDQLPPGWHHKPQHSENRT